MKLTNLFRGISLVASVLFCMSTEAQVADYGKEHGILSFEKSTAPAVASRGASIEISDEHAKLGNRSLKWEWKRKKAVLSFPENVLYLPENPDPKETSVSSFVFWVYSPEKLDGELRISFLKEGRECCFFNYGLGFRGWRGAWVAFDRDMQGTPEKGMDQIRITAPEDVRKGCLYFDGIIPASFQDVRHHTPDWQAPFINEKTSNHWLVLNNSWKLSLDIPLKERLDSSDFKDIKTINDRFLKLVTENVKPYKLKKAKEIYESYHISHNEDGTIKGKPIWFVRYGETFLNLGITDAKQAFKANGQLLRTLNDHLLRIAVSAAQEKDAGKKAEFTRMYIGLTRHLLDQGFAAGSGQGTLHHLGYSMRNFYTAPVIMQEALREAGLAGQVQQAMEWFSGVGEVKVAPKEPGMDIDAFNTSLMGRVASVLMLEDTPYKYAYMQALSRWVDNGLKHTDGLRPCFKRDGSVIHHRKSYPAYASGGFTGAVNAVWMLSRTEFAVSPESHANLKKALLTMKFYSYGDKFPLAMSGRHPDGKQSLIIEQYDRLSLAGTPDGKEALDKELVAREVPAGTRTFGFNCSMSHRYAARLVTVAGHSRYLWSAEIYKNANHYGRYLTHGSVQINRPGDEYDGFPAVGFRQEGWDWCHIPGTTAAVLPMEDMKANVLNVDEYSGYEEMLLSDEWFAGGVTHKGQSGAYAMKLHEHDKYNGSLRARKSFFTFENRLICLGSDIENSLKGAPVHTTLFQNYTCNLPEKVRSPYMNDRGDIIRDGCLDVYFVRNDKAHRIRGIQHSLHEETDAPTEGDFEKAYIDHGDVVKDGRYEYMCFMPVTKEDYSFIFDENALEQYSQNLPYTLLRHDSNVHGILDRPTGTRAFSVFEEGKVDSLIVSSSPAMIMYSTDDDVMTLSVSNPDLALYEGPSDEVYDENGKRIERSVYGRSWIDNPCGQTRISLVLNGIWKISDAKGCDVTEAHADGKTILTFRSMEARTEEITLSTRQAEGN